MAAAFAPAKEVPDFRNTEERNNKEHPGDQNDPPGAGQKRLFRQRQHASPRNDFNRQPYSKKAKRRLSDDCGPYVHYHHEHDGAYEVRGQMLDHDVHEAAAHHAGNQNILGITDLPDFSPDHFSNAHPAGYSYDDGYSDDSYSDSYSDDYSYSGSKDDYYDEVDE